MILGSSKEVDGCLADDAVNNKRLKIYDGDGVAACLSAILDMKRRARSESRGEILVV